MNNNRQTPKTARQFVKICLEDLEAIIHYKWTVVHFWHSCWKADPYGSRWMVCPKPDMSERSFREAKKILQELGFFVFRRVCDYDDSRKTSHWEVKNLHGARVKTFWLHQLDTSGVADEDPEVAAHYEKGEAELQARKTSTPKKKKSGKSPPKNAPPEQIDGTELPPISEKSSENQCLQTPSVSSQELLTEEFLKEEQVTPALGAALPVPPIEVSGEFQENSVTAVNEVLSSLPVVAKLEPQIEVSEKSKLLAQVSPELPEVVRLEIPETVAAPVSDWTYSTPEERRRAEAEFEKQRDTAAYQQTKTAASANIKQQLLLTALSKTKNPIKRQQLHNQLRETGWQPTFASSDNSSEVHHG